VNNTTEMLLAFIFSYSLSFFLFSPLFSSAINSNLLFIIGPQIGKDANFTTSFNITSWCTGRLQLSGFTSNCHFGWFCTRSSGCSTSLDLGFGCRCRVLVPDGFCLVCYSALRCLVVVFLLIMWASIIFRVQLYVCSKVHE